MSRPYQFYQVNKKLILIIGKFSKNLTIIIKMMFTENKKD